MRDALLANAYLRPPHYLMKVSRQFISSPVDSQPADCLTLSAAMQTQLVSKAC